MFDLLVIDDEDRWRDIIAETFAEIYDCDLADTFEKAIAKINAGKYRVICLNWTFHSMDKGRRLLTLLKERYPGVPVVLISGRFGGALTRIQSIQSRYPNVRQILVKVPDSDQQRRSDFVSDLLDLIPSLVRGSEGQRSALSHETGEKEQGVISWLHLSDLHVGCEERKQDWQSLREALLKDLTGHRHPPEQQAGHSAGIMFEPDFLFITGDIAYRAKQDEYKDAQAFLESIWSLTGLGRDQTFIVPGNHDVDRTSVKNNIFHELTYERFAQQNTAEEKEEWVNDIEKLCSDGHFSEILELKFRNYVDFASQFTATPDDGLYYVQPVTVRDVKVDIVGLNSALMSWKDREDTERGLWIGAPQYNQLKSSFSDEAAIRIALVHHPCEALHPYDIDWNWERVEKACEIALHGHLHRPKAILKKPPGRSHLCLSGGSVHQGGVWRSQHYSYSVFNAGTRELDLYMRMTTSGTAEPLYVRDSVTYAEEAPNGYVQIRFD